MLDAINLMVRQNLTLRQAAQQLGEEITPQQADNIQGRIRFQDALEEARMTYYAEIGSNPRLTKDAVVGQLYKLAERLANDREDYKAADSLLKLAKVQGWLSGEDYKDKPVYANLTQADIDRLRAEYKAKQEQQERAAKEAGKASEQAPAKVN
jgi:hypothetical protein